MYFKIGVLKIFAKFTRTHIWPSSTRNEVASWNIYPNSHKDTCARVSGWKCCKNTEKKNKQTWVGV